MITLACDTSTSILSVALSTETSLMAEWTQECGRAHTERLMEVTRFLLKEADTCLADVDHLAVSRGPGSFTGLRVGISAWQGLALGANKPLVGVSTLDAMSRLVTWEGQVCTLLDARMHEVFFAVYLFENGLRTQVVTEQAGPIDDLLDIVEENTLFLGNGAALYRDTIKAKTANPVFAPPWMSVPRAAAVAAESRAVLCKEPGMAEQAVEPVYLRKAQAELARKRSAAP